MRKCHVFCTATSIKGGGNVEDSAGVADLIPPRPSYIEPLLDKIQRRSSGPISSRDAGESTRAAERGLLSHVFVFGFGFEVTGLYFCGSVSYFCRSSS